MAEEKTRGMGLLPKLILGTFIPILLAFVIVGGMIFVSIDIGPVKIKSIREIGAESLRELSEIALKEATKSLNALGEKAIREKAESVARQIEVYIKSNPKLKDVKNDPLLKEIAVQRVGETGYTAVHDVYGINYFHSNPKIINTDLSQLATKLPEFWKILEKGLKGPADGYYNWRDPDGKLRPKYMYNTPVAGTNLIVAATTYIDEFSQPAKAIISKMNKIEQQYTQQYTNKFTLFLIVVVLDLFVLLAIIYLYSRSIIKPIRYLAEVADKISMGDLKTTINVKTKGEVTVLAESIERMQASVRAAIERLQRR